MNENQYNLRPETNWKEQAKALFFDDHIGIGEITLIVKKARETVSRYLSDCDGYGKEMEFRQIRASEKRREYKRQWDRDNRAGIHNITKESIRREHETAARILSSDRFSQTE